MSIGQDQRETEVDGLFAVAAAVNRAAEELIELRKLLEQLLELLRASPRR